MLVDIRARHGRPSRSLEEQLERRLWFAPAKRGRGPSEDILVDKVRRKPTALAPSRRGWTESERKAVRVDSSRRHSKVELTLVPVDSESDILPEYRGTAVGDLLAYHNVGIPHRRYSEPELLIGMCMDHRVQLRIPSDFAFVLRCAGANLGMLEFDVSFAIAVGRVRFVCLIGHDGCRMVDVASNREAFVSGLIDNAGWDRKKAEEHFDTYSSRYGFGDVTDFVWLETQRLRERYTSVTVAPLVYSLGDRRVRQIVEAGRSIATARRIQ